jgi:phage terminase large subunit-like protein
LSDLYSALANALEASTTHDWRIRARPAQLPPPGDWRIWLLLAGRGYGKTRVLCEWVLEQVYLGVAKRIALVAATASDARDVLVEGESGIMNCAPRWNRPEYEPTKRRLTWPNGAIATTYSADESERLRGPQHDAAVCDELGTWRYPESWDMLMLGLRLGRNPRCVVATTPRPTKLIKQLVSREGHDVAVTRGSTRENAANLAPQFLETIVARYQNTRLGRQELDGELLLDTPNALWTREMLEETRVESAPPLQRIVIGVDPAGSTSEGADLTGIVAAGIGHDGHLYVLSDLSCRGTPREWASKVVGAFHSLRADKVICEVNYGGQMAVATIASVDPAVPVKEISSSRAKVLRAEPIASLFEQKRAHIVGSLPELEDQMCSFTADWDRSRDGSPDRVDAVVFAGTELMIGRPVGGFFGESLVLRDGVPVTLPRYPRYVVAVIAGSKEQDAVAIVYVADIRSEGLVVILDWHIEGVEAGTVERTVPAVVARGHELAAECGGLPEDVATFVVGDTGIAAAIFQQGRSRGRVFDTTQLLDLPADPAELVNDVTATIHGGKVKITIAAHAKQAAFDGTTTNHFLAQFKGFQLGAEKPERSELLTALCIALLICSPTEVRHRRRRRRTS